MADIDISAAVQTVGVAENVGGYMGVDVSVVQAVGAIAEAVTIAEFNTQMWRGVQTATVALLIADYQLITHYAKYAQTGFPLKGLILIPGTGAPDTFSIKDGSDTGPYLYYGIVSAPTNLVFNSIMCKPYIDYSECSLSSGHKITFAW